MKRPAFLFYPGDWLRDPGVRLLSPREKGVYIEMLIFLFDSGGYIDLSVNDLMHALNFRTEEHEETSSVDVFSAVLDKLLKCGVVRRTEDGRLYNKRILCDLEDREEVSQKRSEAGKLGAQRKWQKDGKCHNKDMANGWQNDGKVSEVCQENEMAKDGYSISSSISVSDSNLKEKNYKKEKPRNLSQGTMPTNEQEAVDFCAGTGVPEDFIRKHAWPNALVNGFKTSGGNPIAHWPQYCVTYYANWNNKRQMEKQGAKPERKLQYESDRIHLKSL